MADLFAGAGPDALVPILPQEVGLTRTFWLLTHADTRDLARIRVAADFIARMAQEGRAVLMPG